jgi:hypothetical protein
MKKTFTLLTVGLLYHFHSNAQTRIPIEDVSKNIGKTVTVCGKIYGVKLEKSNSKRTLLSMGGFEQGNKVTVIVNSGEPKGSGGKADDTFSGKNVCVTGKLTRVNGNAELLVNDASDIQIQTGGGGSEIRLKDFLPFD